MNQITPSPGNVIRARHRLWRVDDVRKNIAYVTSIDGGDTEQHQFYIPLEEIKRGQLERPDPNRVGTPQFNDLLLRAYRLSMLHGTAPLLSLQRSSVIPTDYQLVPVVMALDMPRVRLLIADDVGLGKTIEAGLIVTELLARQRARNLLVICPANLREQWREQLRRFFHLDARIISSRHRRQMERELPVGANPWEFYPFLITSVDYAKESSIKHQILAQRWDIVVIDEAHGVAKPHQNTPDEEVEMERWKFAQELAQSEKVNHLLLLTATPHSGYTDSYASLLRLLDVGAVSGPDHLPQIHREVARKHVCQRRRRDLEQWFSSGDGQASPFPERDQAEIIVPIGNAEREAIKAIREYGAAVMETALGTRHYYIAQWTVLHLHRRGLSSPEALRRSLKRREESLQQRRNRLEIDANEADPTVPAEVARANVLDTDTGERIDEEEAGRRVERMLYGSPEAIDAELELIAKALEAARKVTPKHDSKLKKLLTEVLPEQLRIYPKVLIFTKYKDTLEYLEQQIRRHSAFKGIEVHTLHGDMNERQRREGFAKFEKAEKAVLIATDCISEGVNLQHACAQIIHYELPWNPNRLEQRNGRVDRFGQREPVVYIRTLVMDERLDMAMLRLLVQKAAAIRSEYGWCPPYFADEREIIRILEAKGLAPIGPDGQLAFSFEDSGGEDDGLELYPRDALQRIHSESFYGQTDIQLPDVQQRLRKTYDTVASPEQVCEFVHSALSRFGCIVSENDDGTYRIVVNEPNLQMADTDNTVERATFDPKVALDDPEVIVLDLGHPLVRRLIDVVKLSVFRHERHYGRTAYRVTPDVEEVTALLYVLARYQVKTKPVSIIEELIPLVLPVYSDRPLPSAQAEALLNAKLSPQTRTTDEVCKTLADLLERNDLEPIIARAVDERKAEIVAERREWLRAMGTDGEEPMGLDTAPTSETPQASQLPEWLKGVDQLEVASTDLLTITLFYPG